MPFPFPSTTPVPAAQPFQNFTRSQMMRESGGRQFDESGNPLVGHYRDGSTPPPDKQAFGVAQMQVATAKAVAAKHGVAFDESRFMNDAGYNQNLGDLHMGDLRAKYGDTKMAEAAYHSGEGTVDRAISRFGRAGFAQGLGPEGRAYIGQGGSNVAGQKVPGGTLPPAVDVSKIQPTAAETGNMNQGSEFNIADPFGAGPGLKAQLDTVQTRGQQVDDVLSNVLNEVNAIQPQREEALKTAVDAKGKILDQVRTETEGLITQAQPLFQKREAIAQRRTELASMNPFARAIKSVFDPNYNDTDLQARDRVYANQLDVLGQDHKYVTELQDTLTRLIDADYNNHDAMYQLHTQGLTQNVQLLTQSYGMADSIFSSSLKGLEAQTTVLRTQAFARQDALSRLSVGEVNSALSQAQQDPHGIAIVNGVPLGIGELKQAQTNYQEQQIGLESRQLALDSGKLGLASQYEDRLIGHMTPVQIDEAIKAGGKYQGQQLDMAKLTQTYGQLRSRQEQQATDIARDSAPGVMGNLIAGVRNNTMAATTRMMGMLGTVPDEQRQALASTTAEIKSIADGFDVANKQGIGSQYAAQNLQRLQALHAQQSTIIIGVAKRWAGGNKDLEAVGEGWLRGQPVSSDVAVRGLITMARNGVPAGTKLSGPAAQSFRIVQQLVRAADQPQAGTDIKSLMAPKQNSKEHEQQLMRQVQATLSNTYSDRMMDSVIRATPTIAKQVMVSGNWHPFSQVSAEDFQHSMAYGDEEGFKRIGTDLGLNPDQTKQMFSQGVNGPLWAQVKKAKNWDDSQFGLMGRRLSAMQTQAFMGALDVSPSAHHGFRPSAAYANLMNNPSYQNAINNVIHNAQGGSFGDYMVGNVAGGGFGDKFQNYALGTRTAYATLTAGQTQNRIRQQAAVTGDPYTRVGMVMAHMQGVSRQDSDALVHALRPLVPENAADNPTEALGAVVRSIPFPSAQAAVDRNTGATYNRIASLIQNHKFADPQLEAIRKRVSGQWADSDERVGRLVNYLSQGN